MPVQTVRQIVAQPPHLVDFDAVKLAAVKTINAGATTSHGAAIQDIGQAGGSTYVDVRVTT